MFKTSILHKANARWMPERLLYAPDWLVLGVNNVCNLHCKMCDVGLGKQETVFAQNLTGTRPLNMPMELISKIIDRCAKQFPTTKLGYAFTEPLVYPHLIESLALAHQRGLYTSITTNALTLPQKAEALSKAGLNEIFISLDGPQEIHNHIRGNDQSFQKAIQGIEKLLTFTSRPEISIFCVITEWNIGHLNEFLDFFRSMPLKEVGFMHTNFTPEWLAEKHNADYGSIYPASFSNTSEINIEAMDFDLLWQELASIKAKKYPFRVSFSPEISNVIRLKEFYNQPEIFFGKRCNDAFRNIMIKSDGSVIPAHGRCYNLTLGNVYTDDLKSIWNSVVTARFRSDLNKAGGLFPACSRCCSAF